MDETPRLDAGLTTMNLQVSLPGMDAEEALFRPTRLPDPQRRLDHYKLLFALFPEPEDADRLFQSTRALAMRHGRLKSRLGPERLHVTLCLVRQFQESLPQAEVDAAIAVAHSVADGCPAPLIQFNEAVSVGEAFFLRCDAQSHSAVARLRKPLAAQLRRNGLKPLVSDSPHMTLGYGGPASTEAIDPIPWRAHRVRLIVSHAGLHHHETVAEWILAPDSWIAG